MAIKIYINPGHGGHDSGAVGVGGRQEKDDTLKYASRVAELLKQKGYMVKLERSNDSFINVTQIAEKANKWGADYFISFHRNSGGGNGAECLITSKSSPKSRELAQAILNSLVANGFRDRGVKVQDKRTYVLLNTKMPGTTIEAGFVDSAKDNNIFDAWFENICVGIADAIASVAGNPETGKPEVTVKPVKPFTVSRELYVTTPYMRGDDVKAVQEALIAKGYNPGKADGVFGNGTKEAVIAFQANNNIKQTGIVGKATTADLGGTWVEIPEEKPVETPPVVEEKPIEPIEPPTVEMPVEPPVIKPIIVPQYKGIIELKTPYMRGEEVKMVQERLNELGYDAGKADGIFGRTTERAVKKFQQKCVDKGLKVGNVDGKVGKKTWRYLWT